MIVIDILAEKINCFGSRKPSASGGIAPNRLGNCTE
jgi:hypothetical protein